MTFLAVALVVTYAAMWWFAAIYVPERPETQGVDQ